MDKDCNCLFIDSLNYVYIFGSIQCYSEVVAATCRSCIHFFPSYDDVRFVHSSGNRTTTVYCCRECALSYRRSISNPPAHEISQCNLA